jgi:prepilin-type N-terminal cleavage/methylation domain-containing protein
MNKVLKCSKGFTLIELMVVIIIIAILAAIAVPLYNTYSNSAKFAEAKNLIGVLNNSAKLWASQYGDYTQNGGWKGVDVNNTTQESKYFPGTAASIITVNNATSYTLKLTKNANGAADPINSVTLTHTDGQPDPLPTVDPVGLPGCQS